MAITAYVGLPGSGKSYGVVENVIIPALEQGREVWTNIPFITEKVVEQFGYSPIHFDTQDILENDRWFQEVLPKGVLIVIDEVWRLWPSGLKANNAAEGHKSFLAEHRHMVGDSGKSIEVVLVTQDLSQIASFARVLVEYTFRAVKLTKVGASNKYRIDIYYGSVTGPSPPESKRDRAMYGSYKKKVYSLYKSHTMSSTGMAGDESSTDQRFNILKGASLKVVLVVIVLGTLFTFWGFSQVFSAYGISDENKNIASGNHHPGSANAVHIDSDGKITQLSPQQSASIKSKSKRHYDFLGDKQLIITANLGVFPNVDFVFSIDDDSISIDLTVKDIERLGYRLEPINQCLVFLHINNDRHAAYCHSGRQDQFLDINLPGSESMIES